MLKKLIALLFALAVFNVQASVPVTNLKTLSGAFDNLNFALTVEWDQKDKKFYNAQMAEFKKEVIALQKKGMTNSEILEFAKINIKNKKLAGDLDELFAVVKTNKMTEGEARNFLLTSIGKNYSEGASWQGGALASTAGLVVLIVFIVLLASVDTGSTGYYGDDCYYEEVCVEYYDYDYYGWYYDCYDELVCY